MGTAFRKKFVLNTKVENCAFWNIPNLSLCCNSITLNINFKSKWFFWNTNKIYRKYNFKESGSSYNLGQESVNKLTKLSKVYFSMKYFTVDFWRISRENVKICFLSSRQGICYQIQALQRYSWKVLSRSETQEPRRTFCFWWK